MPRSLEPLDLTIQIPYHFRCPISLELMTDPVTVSTGQSYDRCSIESWIATGNTTCPVTRAPLDDFTLIPNHTLRRLIQEWCVANRSFGVERIPTPKQPADPILIRSLLVQVASPCGCFAAVKKLRTLARDSEKNRHLISSTNEKEILIEVLFTSEFPEVTYEIIALLAMLALSEPECVSIASVPHRISLFSRLLFDRSFEVRVNAAAIIEAVVTGTRTPELQNQVAEFAGIFDGITDILRFPVSGSSQRTMRVGVKAMFALCLSKQTRGKAVEAGAAEALIARLGELDKCDAERALATIELLSRVPEGCTALGGNALTVPVLVKSMLRVSERATEYAAGALVALCSSSERCLREAAAAGVMTQLLLLVQSDCTDRAKRKAHNLLKLLRDSWPDHWDAGTSDNVFGCIQVFPF